MEKIKEKEQKEAKQNLMAYEYSTLYLHKEYFVIATYQPNEETYQSAFPPYVNDYRFTYNTAIFRPPNS